MGTAREQVFLNLNIHETSKVILRLDGCNCSVCLQLLPELAAIRAFDFQRIQLFFNTIAIKKRITYPWAHDVATRRSLRY